MLCEKVKCATISSQLYTLLYIKVECYLPLQQLHSHFRNISNGVYVILDAALLTMNVCFSPCILTRGNKMAAMTASCLRVRPGLMCQSKDVSLYAMQVTEQWKCLVFRHSGKMCEWRWWTRKGWTLRLRTKLEIMFAIEVTALPCIHLVPLLIVKTGDYVWYQGDDFDMHSPSLFTHCFVFPAYVAELHV